MKKRYIKVLKDKIINNLTILTPTIGLYGYIAINEEYIAILYFSNANKSLDYWYVGHKKKYFKYINSLIKSHISNKFPNLTLNGICYTY
jgi:hypothetical protein